MDFVVCGHGFVRLGHGFTRHPVDWLLAAARVHLRTCRRNHQVLLVALSRGCRGGRHPNDCQCFFFRPGQAFFFIPWFCLKLDVKLVSSPDFQAAISELDRKVFGACYLQGFGMNVVLPNRPRKQGKSKTASVYGSGSGSVMHIKSKRNNY
jgi:hypothetical protein